MPLGQRALDVRELSIWLVIGFGCLALAWLLPEHYLPWTTFRQEALAACAALMLVGATLERSSFVVWPRIGILLIAVAAVPLIQWATGQIRYRDDAILASSYVALSGVCACIGASLVAGTRRQQFLDALTACLVLAGIASAGMALCQWLGPNVLMDWVQPMPARGRPFANIGQPNHLSTQLLLGFAGLLYWYETRRTSGRVTALAAAWLGWGVVMTQSRTGWLAVGAFAAWWLLMRSRTTLRLQALPVLIGCIAFVAAVLAQGSLFVLWNDPGYLGSTAPALRLTTARRGLIWEMLWHALMQSPWIGYGWGQVASAHFVSASHFPGAGTWLSHSHNLLLDLMIYNGIPIGLLIALLLLVWFTRRIRECRDSQTWCWMFALFAIFLHAMFEFPLHYAYFLVPTGLLLGIVSSTTTSIRTGKWSLVAPTALLTLALTSVAVEYVNAEESLRDLRLASFHVGRPPGDLPKPDWVVLESWKDYHEAVAMSIHGRMRPEDIQSLRDLARRYPYPNVLSQYAHATALNGQMSTSMWVLAHTCKVHSEVVCDAVRIWWTRLGTKHPELAAVAFPVPPR